MRDFWRRWHISLSTWFRDYVYIPLGGSRVVKIRVWFNLMVTMLVSGLWHGAAWTFIAWGALNGLGSIVSAMFDRKNWYLRIPKLLKQIVVFAFITITWIFFRAPSIGAAVDFLRCLAAGGGVNDLVLPIEELRILALGIAVLAIFDLIKRRKGQTPDDYLMTRRLSTEWGVIIFLIVCIFVFGEYGPTFDPKAFIYFQF